MTGALKRALLVCLVLAGCPKPTPPPRPVPAPPDPVLQQFDAALFSIYHRARLKADVARHEGDLVPLSAAAGTVFKGSRRFGDIWRVLGITQLAAADVSDPAFARAITTLSDVPTLVRRLTTLLDGHPRDGFRERQRTVYEYLMSSKVVPLALDGIPDCPHTYPDVTASSSYGVAVSTASVWVQKPLDHLKKNLDPQGWSNDCGKLFFNLTYLTDLKSDGTFDVDNGTHNAKPATPQTPGDPWGSRYLFEHFTVPSAGSNFFKNILAVTPTVQPGRYDVTYSLAVPLFIHVAPDPEQPGGLFADEGGVSAVEASPWSVIEGHKTVRFDELPSHTADQLADEAATTLQLMSNALPYWVCCPR